jgi:uncharacterized membrane protein
MNHFSSKYKSLTGSNLIFYGFLFVYFVLLFYLCSQLNLWVDETFTLDTTSRGFLDVIRQSYKFEGQPPVYFILFSLWRNILPGIFFAKLFSVLCIGLSAWFFYRLVKLVGGNENSRWMLVVFLLNPFTIWAALEMRTYSLLILFSILSIYFFFQYYLSQRKKYLYLFLAISLIGLYTQYFFALQISALAISLLIFKGWKSFFELCLYLVPVVLLFLPNLFFIREQLTIIQPRNLIYTTAQKVIIVLHSPQNFMLALQLIPLEKWVRWIIKISCILSILFAYYKLFKTRNLASNVLFKRLNFIVVAVAALLVLFCLIVAISGILYADRYMAVAFPFFILIFILFKAYPNSIRTFLYSVISMYFILLLMSFYRYPVKKIDYKLIGKYVSSIERKNEPILFYSNSLSLTFKYYYPGHNDLEPLPHEVHFDSSFMESLKDTLELEGEINKIHTGSGSYLFISDPKESSYVIELSRKAVDSFLNNHYHIALDTLFFGRSREFPLRIRRLEKPVSK